MPPPVGFAATSRPPDNDRGAGPALYLNRASTSCGILTLFGLVPIVLEHILPVGVAIAAISNLRMKLSAVPDLNFNW